MKYLIFLFALIVAAFAAPQYHGHHHPVGAVPPPNWGQFTGSASNAQASSQSFNSASGYPGFGTGFTGSAANAAASSQTVNQGGYGR